MPQRVGGHPRDGRVNEEWCVLVQFASPTLTRGLMPTHCLAERTSTHYAAGRHHPCQQAAQGREVCRVCCVDPAVRQELATHATRLTTHCPGPRRRWASTSKPCASAASRHAAAPKATQRLRRTCRAWWQHCSSSSSSSHRQVSLRPPTAVPPPPPAPRPVHVRCTCVAMRAAAAAALCAPPATNTVVEHSLDLDVSDEPLFLLACAHWQLGLLYQRQDSLAAAEQQLRASLALFPGFVAAAAALAQVRGVAPRARGWGAYEWQLPGLSCALHTAAACVRSAAAGAAGGSCERQPAAAGRAAADAGDTHSTAAVRGAGGAAGRQQQGLSGRGRGWRCGTVCAGDAAVPGRQGL
jgi:hypothetical protein